MKYRSKMSRKSSKRVFTKKALNVKPQNAPSNPMRGGIRM